jgi:patatin-like phospholipase/acyl hydrolase
VLLSLDGGGIRGLITIQLLLAIETQLRDRLFDYVDWVAGTSTGSFIAAGLAADWSLRDVQRLYLRLKDQLFEGWARPYNTEVLEAFVKQELGATSTMADLTPTPTSAKVIVTTVIADHVPTDLHLFRSYQLPVDLQVDTRKCLASTHTQTNADLGYTQPRENLLWYALRCSSAAPTYFASVDNKYMDGGLMANNPTLVLMQQVDEYNTTIDYVRREQPTNTALADGAQRMPVACVISIGCGRIPDVPVDQLDMNVSVGTSRQPVCS